MSGLKSDLYFAYGSNLHREQMKERCPDSQIFTKAILQDYKLVFPIKAGERWDFGGAAGIEPEQGQQVEGFLYRMTAECFSKMDYFEGIHENHYHRELLSVRTEQGAMDVYTYICNGDGAYHTPSLKYMNAICKGAEQAGLSQSYRDKLEKLRNSSVSKG